MPFFYTNRKYVDEIPADDIIFCNTCNRTNLKLCFICQKKVFGNMISKGPLKGTTTSNKTIFWRNCQQRKRAKCKKYWLYSRLSRISFDEFLEMDVRWHQSCYSGMKPDPAMRKLIQRSKEEDSELSPQVNPLPTDIIPPTKVVIDNSEKVLNQFVLTQMIR